MFTRDKAAQQNHKHSALSQQFAATGGPGCKAGPSVGGPFSTSQPEGMSTESTGGLPELDSLLKDSTRLKHAVLSLWTNQEIEKHSDV